MFRTDRVLAILVLCCAALAAGCGSPSLPTPQSCSGDEACAATARCVSHACIENALPTAEFSTSGELVASGDITLDASTSSDPDDGDVLSSYHWSVTSADAACEAPVISSTEQTVHVRFACGGHWDVQLIVFDGKQAESAPRVHTLVVAERAGPAIVVAGADQSFSHYCGGTPVKCTPAAALRLSATLNSQAALTVRWTVQPPAGRPLDSTRRVVFTPDATSLTPTAVIETDGTAISGDWVFRVEALNGADVLASDVTRVSVLNRAPTVSATQPGPLAHSYAATSGFFVVNGSIPVEVLDPDGDPVTRTFAVHHSGDGESSFTATDNGSSIGVSIMVPGLHPEWLIAPAGLSRSVTLDAADVNGAAASPVSYAVSVGDRPPVPRGLSAGGVMQHTFNPTELTYVSTPSLGFWSDPDGDPLDHLVTMTDASAADCATSTLLSDGTVRVNCERRWTSGSDLASFTAPRSATVQVWDPWPFLGKSVVTVPFRIGNRAPTAASSSLSRSAGVSCSGGTGGGFCGTGGSGSPPPSSSFSATATTSPLPGLTDPDGDPLQITPDPSVTGAVGSSCSGTQVCSLAYTIPKTSYCTTPLPATTVPFTVTDGVAPVALSLTLQPFCQ